MRVLLLLLALGQYQPSIVSNQGKPGDASWPVTVTNLSGSTLVLGADGGAITVNEGVGPDGGVFAVYVANQPASQAVTGTFFQATQPVSAAALPLPSGAATEATLATRTKPSDQQHVVVDSSASVAVTGPATDTQLRATPLPVSGTVSVGTVPVTGTFFQATQPVSLASAPSTPVTNANLDVALSTRTKPADQQHAIIDSSATIAVTVPLNPIVSAYVGFDAGFVSVANFPATQPVSGTFWQATQPISGTVTANAGSGTQAVSIASMPSTPVTGTFFQSVQPVSQSTSRDGGYDWGVNVDNFPASQAVTGTFWQATQPVSGTVTANAGSGTQAVSIASMPSTPVTGTFWQATQPVSIATAPALVASSAVIGHVIVDTAPTTAVTLATAPTTPVTGTFWQATQPVSGTVTANAGSGTMAVSLASAPTTPVTGTFWQATQPVSIASMPSTPVTGAFFQATQPVSGTFFQATQPVSLASAPTTPVTGTFWQSTQPVSVASLPASASQGVDPNGTAQTMATTTTGVQLVSIVNYQPPLNPFLLRCNAVRRTNCQP